MIPCIRWATIVVLCLASWSADAQTSTGARSSGVIFLPSKQLESEIHKAPGVGPDTFSLELGEYSAAKGGAEVVRRTKPHRAEVHKVLIDVWYVIRGEGTLVTGGSLAQPTQTEPDEFRGPAIAGGDEQHIGPGDFVRIPAGVPHWIRQIDGDEIDYLVVKLPK